MNTHIFLARLSHSLALRLVALAIMVQAALAWNNLAVCAAAQTQPSTPDWNQIMSRVEQDPNLVFKKLNGNKTLLHFAAHDGRMDVARLLLSKGAEVNSKDDAGFTPLHVAAFSDHAEIVELLLSHQADIDAKNHSGLTALMVAVDRDFKDVVHCCYPKEPTSTPRTTLMVWLACMSRLPTVIRRS